MVIILALTGTIASGKELVNSFFKSKGFITARFSDVLREELESEGVPITRKSLQDKGNELREKYGPHVLSEMILKQYPNQNILIDGLRNPGELEFLRTQQNFHLLGIDAPFEIRWERVKKRQLDKDDTNIDEFKAHDARDRGLNEPESGQQVDACLKQADFLIINDIEFEQFENSPLHRRLEEIYIILSKTS